MHKGGFYNPRRQGAERNRFSKCLRKYIRFRKQTLYKEGKWGQKLHFFVYVEWERPQTLFDKEPLNDEEIAQRNYLL